MKLTFIPAPGEVAREAIIVIAGAIIAAVSAVGAAGMIIT